jgi:hypothetical protein
VQDTHLKTPRKKVFQGWVQKRSGAIVISSLPTWARILLGICYFIEDRHKYISLTIYYRLSHIYIHITQYLGVEARSGQTDSPKGGTVDSNGA